MAQDYVVQKGDTRSGIAKKLGVSLDQVGMGKAGTPDLIYAGETLKVGAPKSDASTYASEVSSQLKDTGSGNKSVSQQVYGSEPSADNDPYDIGKLRTEIDGYKTKMDAAFQNLKTIQTDTYNKEYDSRKLSEKKQKIADLDTEIATAKSERDAAISKLRQNPGLSAAQLTGQAKKIADFQNDKINNLITQRNGAAGEYNSELAEIDKVVGRTSSDANAEYTYYSNLLGNAQNNLSSYQNALTQELRDTQTQSNWEKQLAQALQIAGMKGSGSSNDLRLVTNPVSGEPIYWANTETGEIFPIDTTGTDQESGSTGGEGSAQVTPPGQQQQKSGGIIQGILNWLQGKK